MFAIYNNGSVSFRSTSDNLYTLDKVDELAASRHKPNDDMIHDFSGSSKKKNQNHTDEKAINAYKKIANMDTNEKVYHVYDIMTKSFISINHEYTIEEAYKLLKENKISQIPVVSFGNKIVGMINKKIILNLLFEDLDNSSIIVKKRLNEIPLPKLITTEPISDIRRVAKVMIDFKLDAIPVVDEHDIVVGIVSKTDIIKTVSHIPNFQLWG